MAVAVDAFVEALEQLPLLDDEQRGQLAALSHQFRDLDALAQELVRRGWLTSFQARQLTAGNGNQLVLDQYVLLDLLGQGGMGAVYKARQRWVKRDVALKLIRADALQSPGAVERFQREAEIAAQLSHPNIITLHDANEVNGVHFLVLEYIEGTDLSKLVKQRGPLPVALACDCIRQAALGLQHAHERGLVHRDIKPHNLMLTKQGVVKLMDLGLARTVHAAEESAASGGLTATGAIIGTADYLAPEQAQDAKHVDTRADIYALGCAMYHLLAGQPPFAGGTLASKIGSHLFTEPQPIEERRPDVPPELGAVLRRMMAKQPEQRYQAPAEVALALDSFVPCGTVASAESPTPGPAKAVVSAGAGDRGSDTSPALTRGMAEETLAAGQLPGLPFPDGEPAGRRTAPRLRPQWLAAVVPIVAAGILVAGLLLTGVFSRSPTDTTGAAVRTTGALADEPPSPLPDVLTLDLGNGVKLDLVRVRKGAFFMGSPTSDPNAFANEQPQHAVEIRKDFFLGKYPVTQQQYERVMGENPSWFSAKGDGKDKVAGLDTRRLPVERVTWEEAKTFCAKLSTVSQRRVGLPTEAEWEYACRATTKTPYYCGGALKDSDANFDSRVGRTTAVGQYPANAWGLHDMAGNVWQWCADGSRTYTNEKRIDPVGPDDDSARVLRGGAWGYAPRLCRSACRLNYAAAPRGNGFGFRVAVRLN